MRIAFVWATVATTVGIVTGFTLGQAREQPRVVAQTLRQSPQPKPPTTAPTSVAAVASVRPEPSATSGHARVRCTGQSLKPHRFHTVIGIKEAHAEQVAAAAGIDGPVTRRFKELEESPTARGELTDSALAAAARGPVLLVLLLSPGNYQVELARQVLERRPDSAVAVVDDSGARRSEDLARFPVRSVLVSPGVSPDLAGIEAWAAGVHKIATGEQPCSGG